MNVLVTGGAGYKGIVLTTKLLDKGYKVTVVDNFMYGYEPILHLAKHPKLTIVKKDIRNGIEDLQNRSPLNPFSFLAQNQTRLQILNSQHYPFLLIFSLLQVLYAHMYLQDLKEYFHRKALQIFHTLK